MCGDADAHVVLAVTHTLFRSLLVDTRHVASIHDAPHLHSLILLYAIDVRGELHDALHFRPVILLYVTSVRQLHCNTIDVRGELLSCSVYTLRYDISSFTLLWYNSTKQGYRFSHLHLSRATTPPVSSNQDSTDRP
jgi:hypothetical protein